LLVEGYIVTDILIRNVDDALERARD